MIDVMSRDVEEVSGETLGSGTCIIMIELDLKQIQSRSFFTYHHWHCQ